MTKVTQPIRPWKAAVTAAMVLAAAMPPIQASAQDTNSETRLRKIEAEIRALQRKVFSGPDGKFFEPEIKQGEQPATTPGQPATSALTDILARLDALEAQLARLTGQVELNGNRISKLEAKFAPPEGEGAPAATGDAPQPSSGLVPVPTQTAAPTPTPAPTPTAAPQANLNAMSGGASTAAAPVVAPTTERIEGVQSIVKPQSADAGDDEYSYGFRLWEAKYFPEAQQQLKLYVDKYPSHWRISWGRNLLGRAYLDAGNGREAAKWFLANYQADKSGGRAPDSLLYLAVSMKSVKDTKRACIALTEFSETYAAEAAGRLKSLYDATRNGLNCG